MSEDFLEYYVMPSEQLLIDQVKRYQDIVDAYQRSSTKNREIIESILKNNSDLISLHAEKIQLYEQYLHKLIKNSIINNNNALLKLNNDNSKYNKSNAIKTNSKKY